MIERGIYQLLVADPAIIGIAGDRVSVDVAEDTSGPYLVIALVNNPRQTFLDGSPRQSRARIQIDAYAGDPEEVRELAEAAINLFHGHGAVADGHDIQFGELVSGPVPSYESETGLRRQMMEFQFYYD